MQNIASKRKSVEMQELTSTGEPSIFVFARAHAARRRAQSNAEKKKPLAARSGHHWGVLPRKTGVDKSPKNLLKLPISPPGRSPAPGLLKVPEEGPSPAAKNSGVRSSDCRGAQSSRNPKYLWLKSQGSPASRFNVSPKAPQTNRRKARSCGLAKIDRTAFRCARSGDIRSAYTWHEDHDELGRGGCGVVFLARDRQNPARQVAVKRVLPTSLIDTEKLKEEIEILRTLDHPNVLRLYESFEDGKTVYLVMELCTGGDLFERLQDDRCCTDKYCSEVAAQICGALAHCHNEGICHRDLKPENLLLLSQADDAPIKVADFGLSKHLSSGSSPQKSVVQTCKDKRKVIRRLKTFAGTLEYMAPEVIRIKDEKSGPAAYYDFRCDTWALGVIVNMMLTGHWPFKLEQVAAYVAENVPLPDLDLTGLCTTAQDFISICLQPEFTKRPFPSDLIKHPFLNMTELIVPKNITPMAKRLNHFAHASAVKRAALTAAVRYLKGFEVEELRRRFELFDVDRDGTVTLKEFENAIEKCPQLLAAGDFESAEELFEAIDSDSSGQISFTEFLAAAMDVDLAAREDLARKAFEAFDQKGDGEVSSEDIRRVFGGATRGGKRQDTADLLAELGIKKGEATQFERFWEHLHSPYGAASRSTEA